jgi:hypothetical protein
VPQLVVRLWAAILAKVKNNTHICVIDCSPQIAEKPAKTKSIKQLDNFNEIKDKVPVSQLTN